MSPSWQEWQLIGAGGAVGELKFAWSGIKVGTKVGKNVGGQAWQLTGHAALIWAPRVLCVQFLASSIQVAGFPSSDMPVDAWSAQAAQPWLLHRWSWACRYVQIGKSRTKMMIMLVMQLSLLLSLLLLLVRRIIKRSSRSHQTVYSTHRTVGGQSAKKKSVHRSVQQPVQKHTCSTSRPRTRPRTRPRACMTDGIE